jgi:hypothetical protein
MSNTPNPPPEAAPLRAPIQIHILRSGHIVADISEGRAIGDPDAIFAGYTLLKKQIKDTDSAALLDAKLRVSAGYLTNRQTLMERLCSLNTSPNWSGYDRAHADLLQSIKEIDDRIAALFPVATP